jgi:hypothetical protein
MSSSILANPFSLQLEKDQDKALEILKSKGFNKNKFIRAAVEEKLYRDFRSILKELKQIESDKNTPDWVM